MSRLLWYTHSQLTVAPMHGSIETRLKVNYDPAFPWMLIKILYTYITLPPELPKLLLIVDLAGVNGTGGQRCREVIAHRNGPNRKLFRFIALPLISSVQLDVRNQSP